MAMDIYQQIWNLALPYYRQGREGDCEHVLWLWQRAHELCMHEGVDHKVMIPFVILHDIGYCRCPKENCAKIEMRMWHTRHGADIARDILNKIGYDKKASEEIIFCIANHANWALGQNEVFKKNINLGLFSDLGFTWLVSPKGFEIIMKRKKLTRSEMIDLVEHNEKMINRPFVSSYTRQLYNRLLNERKFGKIQIL